MEITSLAENTTGYNLKATHGLSLYIKNIQKGHLSHITAKYFSGKYRSGSIKNIKTIGRPSCWKAIIRSMKNYHCSL